jgi:hypothetical protein
MRHSETLPNQPHLHHINVQPLLTLSVKEPMTQKQHPNVTRVSLDVNAPELSSKL